MWDGLLLGDMNKLYWTSQEAGLVTVPYVQKLASHDSFKTEP